MPLGQVAKRRSRQGGIGDDQRFGRAIPLHVGRNDVLAFEHAFAGFSPLAGRGYERGGL
jgi:hypothetical protein